MSACAETQQMIPLNACQLQPTQEQGLPFFINHPNSRTGLGEGGIQTRTQPGSLSKGVPSSQHRLKDSSLTLTYSYLYRWPSYSLHPSHNPHPDPQQRVGGVLFTTFSSLPLMPGPGTSSRQMFAELNLSFRHCVDNIVMLVCATYCSDNRYNLVR